LIVWAASIISLFQRNCKIAGAFEKNWTKLNQEDSDEYAKIMELLAEENYMDHFDLEETNIKERTILKNDFAFVFVNQMPIVPGHLLVCPIRPVQKSDDLLSEEWNAIINLKILACQVLKKALGAEGFNFAWNEGKMAGQSVPHFHLHILPRMEGDQGIYEYEPRSFL
jgi:diadenosine tetraphosphate (Ap4A) HIT family hydrolase